MLFYLKVQQCRMYVFSEGARATLPTLVVYLNGWTRTWTFLSVFGTFLLYCRDNVKNTTNLPLHFRPVRTLKRWKSPDFQISSHLFDKGVILPSVAVTRWSFSDQLHVKADLFHLFRISENELQNKFVKLTAGFSVHVWLVCFFFPSQWQSQNKSCFVSELPPLWKTNGVNQRKMKISS